jgi:hypothetical protein
MKMLSTVKAQYRVILLPLTISLVHGLAWAQEKKIDIDVNIDKGGNDWYKQPWVWVVGAAVFILILVALATWRKKVIGV